MPSRSLSLVESDPQVMLAIEAEKKRQQSGIELIASENFVSRAVLEAQGSVLTNKYAEGYPSQRYYGGCEFVDVIERLAIDRARTLFNADYVNVQPHSGSQANQAVMLALLKPGDTIMGMDLSAGGHLTHGASVNISGRWFDKVAYSVRPDSEQIDLDEVWELARSRRPGLIIAGGSAYSRKIDFAGFRKIADDVGAKLLVDMAHFAGLVAAGRYPNPLDFAHVVTTTTHKTLRGPRGGCILTNDPSIAPLLNKAVFPGLQGGPLMHVIAAKAVAFSEASRDSFRFYIHSVIKNAATLADELTDNGFRIVSGGTDTHLLLVDLRALNLTGDRAEKALGEVGITCNKNAIPFDPQKPAVTSGIRLGSAACTTRGFGSNEFRLIGRLITKTLMCLSADGRLTEELRAEVSESVRVLCNRFPLYEHHVTPAAEYSDALL